MTNVVSYGPGGREVAGVEGNRAQRRSEGLADRLVQGARALEAFAKGLTDAEWQSRLPGDGRKVGVIVHHVASVYPVEVSLAEVLASGEPITGITMDNIHEMNAAHALANDNATKEATLELLRRNSEAAAAAIRVLSDEELDRAAPVSLYGNAILTCQFILEDHPVRHSYHHLSRLWRTLQGVA